MVIVFGFDNCQWQVLFVKQDVVRPVAYATRHPFPPHMDLSKREFFEKLQIIPTSHILNGRGNEFCADITLRKVFFVHKVIQYTKVMTLPQ